MYPLRRFCRAFAALIALATFAPATTADRPLAGQRIALLLADEFNAVEAFYPYLRLKEAGAEVILIGAERGRAYNGRGRYPLTCELAVADARADDFSAVVIPGGDAPKRMREIPAVIAFVREMAARDRWIAAVCHGPQLLGAADLLRGRKITSWPTLDTELRSYGALWENAVVVVDGKLITSQDPWTIDRFTAEIIARLGHP